MEEIKVKCPAKINLDLRVFEKDKFGYHPIKSIMQTINLYDYLKITLNDTNDVVLSGNSPDIPYDETNLCYKAAKAYFGYIGFEKGINIEITKNIPICAGLAGGSTDGAGVLVGLNKLFDNKLDESEIHKIASTLGSDLNFCLTGGTCLCQGYGQKIVKMPFYNFKVSLVKPKNVKISSKEAYQAFDELKEISDMRNDLEFAILKLNKYPEIEYLSSLGFQMSGSGPTYFLRDEDIDEKYEIDLDKYLVINGLNSTDRGVEVI